MGAANIVVLFCLVLIVTPLGRIRLGGPDARPDYSAWSWFAMLVGLATSLGLGTEQTAAGLAHLFGVPDTDTTKVLLIVGITGIAMASVVAGMDRGIKRLSQANLLLAVVLDAPVAQRVFWCAFEGIAAITLLLGGGLVALQTAANAQAMITPTWSVRPPVVPNLSRKNRMVVRNRRVPVRSRLRQAVLSF